MRSKELLYNLEIYLLYQFSNAYYFRSLKNIKMETLQSNQQKTSQHQNITLSSPPIFHEQSLNIQRSSYVPFRQLENFIDFTPSHKNADQNTTTSLNEAQICPKKQMHKNSIISNAIAEIDDFQRDDLLLSSSTIRTEDLINQHQTVCKQHSKVEDIICMVQKIKICSYCALFGPHKDHTFKSQSQLLQEILKIEAKIRETDKIYNIVQKQFSFENSLKLVKEYCEAKKQESICELEQQVNGIIQKIRRTKEQIKVKTTSQFDHVVKEIEENWQKTSKNINKIEQYDQWKQKALKILHNFSQKIETCDFMEPFKQYQKFQWEKGAVIVDKYKEILRNFTKRSQESLDDLKFNYSYSIKNILANTIQFDSQKTIEMLNQTPTSSLQELQRQLSFTFRSEALQNSCKTQMLQSKQRIRIRNSEVIQSRLQPIQEQMARNMRYTRCSFNSGNKRMKNDSSFISNNYSTMLTRQRSNPRFQQTMKSPNSRASIYKSPSHYRANKNPLQILSNYERNKNQTSLNFSKCGLSSDQLVYFVQKAFHSHIPIDLNLQRNKLSISGLAKLLPLISKVVSVNLTKTQLDESCLQALCKIKVVRRLYEVNLSQNDISHHKNLGKLQQLRKMGFKIII